MMAPWFSVQRHGDIAYVFVGENIGCFAPDGADELLKALVGVRDVRMTIDSCGGDALAALQIFDGLVGRVTSATIVRWCFSSAVIVAMTARKIQIVRDSAVMLHEPTISIIGGATTLRKSAARLAEVTHRFRDVLCKRTKADPATVRAWLAGPQDHWFTAEQALAVGLADEIIDPPAVSQAVGSAMAGDGADADDSSELLLALLRAVGPVRTKDAKKLLREMSAWVNQNVRQVEH